MSSYYLTIINKVKRPDDYVTRIFVDIFLGANSKKIRFIEINNDNWYTIREVTRGELIQNDTNKYNITVKEK